MWLFKIQRKTFVYVDQYRLAAHQVLMRFGGVGESRG